MGARSCRAAVRNASASRSVLFFCMLCACHSAVLHANASTVAVGFVSWDVTQAGVTGQFDIANESGPNSSFDSTFPISTSVHLTSLVLSIQFNDSSIRQFGMSDLSLNPFDGLSFESPALAIGGLGRKPISASLTGVFSNTSLTLFDGTSITIDPAFSSTIAPSGAALADGDLALITANVSSTPVLPPPPQVTPEPSTWVLLSSGAVLLLHRRKRF